jgi:hypothetical protein
MPNQVGFGRRNCIAVGAAVIWHDEDSQLVVIVMMVDLCLLPEQLVLYCTYLVRIAEKRRAFFQRLRHRNVESLLKKMV